MKRILINLTAVLMLPLLVAVSCGTNKKTKPTIETSVVTDGAPEVYFTKDISPEGLVKLYEALGVEAKGKVAVKISTGESEKSNHLRPDFIAPLLKKVGGVLKNASIGVASQNGNPHKPTIADIGMAASLDPVALDKFCLDQVFTLPNDESNNTKALLERINQRHGTRIVYRAEEAGLGSTKYRVVNLD